MQMSMQQQQGMVIQVSTVLKPHNADVEASQQQGNADVNAATTRHDVNAAAARQCSLKMQMSMQQQQGMVIQVSTVLKPHNADVEASQQQGNADVNAATTRHGNSSIYRVEASQCSSNT
ncbi:hypothetical protein K7X08_016697 [Anisodus acutangulus]|uniref:Uncharacterized protein n=1 Tax=Anisodus acutangulus TaxID=402998 RepID=A0A9Q1LE84_9SOLA|nr:hypothetical protein K7X08_016697 [Anisodus acutangulus]